MFDIFEKKKNEDRRKSIVPILFFAFIAVVGICLAFFHPAKYLELEKRDRKEFPDFSMQAFFSGQWGKNFEEWIADAMPGRDFFMALNAYAGRLLKGNYTGEIYVDQAGNLIEAPVPYDEASLEKNLAAITNFSQNTDIPVYLMVPPTAGYTAKDRLPARIWETYYDEAFMQNVSQQVEGSLEIIDLLKPFSFSDQQLFYQTDHHWNVNGIYLAYTSICDRLGLDKLTPDEYQITRYEGFRGTTYSRSALYLHKPDTLELWQPPCSVSVWFSDTNQTYDSLFFTEYLDDADMYPVYLDSNHGLTVVDNLDKNTGEVLMLVKDSYANSLVPLLIAHYDKIVMVDVRNYKPAISELLDEYGVTQIIVLQSVEHLITDTNLLWIR